MFPRPSTVVWSLALCALGFVVALLTMPPSEAAGPQPPILKSRIVRFEDAEPLRADWGELRCYFRGQTHATKDVLTAVATVKPGKAVHASHRHAQEEYLVVAQGTGTWSLDGKQTPAKPGDVLYVEPWVYHGLINTGDEPLVFMVVRYNGKGVEIPPKPDDRPNEL